MRLYNAIAEGTLQEGENLLVQLDLQYLGFRRARVSSWSVSFDGLIAGNSLSFRIVRDDPGPFGLSFSRAVVLDGTHADEFDIYEPYIWTQFNSLPTALDVIEGPLQASDTSHVLRQYGSGRELILDYSSRTSLRCTPSDMLVPVNYKVNFIFSA